MSDVIIDTNVAVVANGQNAEVVQACVDSCISFLVEVVANCVVLMDSNDEIRAEYSKAIRAARPYELGAQFLLHVLRHLGDENHVRLFELTTRCEGAFVDFPEDPRLMGFDESDRKFAALGHKTRTPVTNATDSDWSVFLLPLNDNGIDVNFLCGCDSNSWFRPR